MKKHLNSSQIFVGVVKSRRLR